MALASGSGTKAPVVVRTVIPGGVSITSGLENGDVVNGITLVTGDIVVVAGHGTPANNGAYIVPASGQASRAPGFTTGAGLHRASFYSMDGETAGQVWAVRNVTEPTVDTDAITISQAYEVQGVEVAGDAESKVGNSTKLMTAQRTVNNTIDLSRSSDLSFLWTGTGPVEPLAFTIDYGVARVLLGIERATGKVIGYLGDSGGGGGGGDASQHSVALGYVEGGVLRAIGGSAGDRTLDNNAAREWIFGQAEMGNVLAVYEDDVGRHLVRVSPVSRDLFPEGDWSVWVEIGQSNAEGQAGSGRVAVVPDARYGSRLLMLGSSIWSAPGQATSGGASNQLDGANITDFSALRDTVAESNSHATTAVAGALRAEMAAAMSECGWLPRMIGWNDAEGGQLIADLSPGAPSGKYAWQNAVTRMTRAQALKPESARLVMRWLLMAQGEGNTSLATLGAAHEALRAAYEAEAQSIFGQAEPVRMITFQPSSFTSNSNGVRSLLDYQLANTAPFGAYWCGGPTYPFPWSPDFLHHTSIGHLMRGEYSRQIAKQIEKTGSFTPLHMVSASVTGTNTITVELSESAIIDNNWLVAAIDNAGITVPGRTVTNVAVLGTTMTITTSSAAAGAATVQSALSGQTNPRTAGGIPRSTVRCLASGALGFFSGDCGLYAGTRMFKPLAHQSIAIS